MDLHKESLELNTITLKTTGTSVPVVEAFRADFSQYERLLHKFARSIHNRVRNLRILMSYEDIFQEVCMTFVIAQKTFKVERGLSFTTYVGRSIYNNINHKINRETTRLEKLRLLYLEELNPIDDDGNELGWESLGIGGESEGADAASERLSEARLKIKMLSPNARKIVKELISPSDALIDICMVEEEIAIKKGISGPIQAGYVRFPFIFQYLHLEKPMITAVKAEFRDILRVTI